MVLNSVQLYAQPNFQLNIRSIRHQFWLLVQKNHENFLFDAKMTFQEAVINKVRDYNQPDWM